nr:ATP-binding protein [Azospirillum sp. B4]
MRALADVRLLRPLLPLPRADFGATCQAFGLSWIDDPSNLMDRYARGRLRRQGGTVPVSDLLAHAADAARVRTALEVAVADAAARHVLLAPEGYAVVDADALTLLPSPVAARLLAGLAAALGGQPYPPPAEAVARLLTALPRLWAPDAGPLALTLAGSQARRLAGAGGRRMLLLLRQAGRMAPPVAVAGGTVRWDGRFQVEVRSGEPDLTLGALGVADARRLAVLTLPALARIPKPVWPTLPVFRRGTALLAVPHLDWRVGPLGPPAGEGVDGPEPRAAWAPPAFRPPSPVAPPPFLPKAEAGLDVMAVVSDARVII